MIARLLISPFLDKRVEEIEKMLSGHGLKQKHPDVLYYGHTDKLGIEQARLIKQYFSLKPYSAKGRAVVLEEAASLTIEAQNALLKILEELPSSAIFILAADSDSRLLPTVVSRCQLIRLPSSKPVPSGVEGFQVPSSNYSSDIEKLLTAGIEERFEYVEKLKDREEFLNFMLHFFHQNLASYPQGANVKFLKELLQAEEWTTHNVNSRAILEYLMLVMPQKV